MKRFLLRCCCAVLAVLLCCGSASADDDKDRLGDVGVAAECAVVLEPVTGTLLYAKNPDQRMLIASTTKIMTALVVLEHCALNEVVNVTPEHAAVEGSSMELEAYHYYTVKDLLYGLMLASGNDAAAALADHCAGSMEAFAAMMNRRAQSLGLENTHFANSHGLDAEGHYSSARDLALITAEALNNETFRVIFGTGYYSVHDTDIYTHNQLLYSLPGCIGGKTGYTMAAGRILVSAVEREGMCLICVTIRDPQDWEDHKLLHEHYFAEWKLLRLPEERWATVETLSGTRDYVPLRCAVPALLVPRAAELQIRAELPRYLFAPVVYGERVGSVFILSDGKPLAEVEVCCGESLGSARTLSAWDRFCRSWRL